MAVNSHRDTKESNKGSFFGWVKQFLHVDESVQEVMHVRFLPQIVFLGLLTILYIANRHSAEKKIRAIAKLEIAVDDLRADYTTLKANYMLASKQSEVAKRASRLGLKENNSSPILISTK